MRQALKTPLQRTIKRYTGLLLSLPLAGISLPVVAQTPAGSKLEHYAIEEVLVTARRRVESIQETPIAVTAITGDDLREQGIGSTDELAKTVPSLHIANAAAVQIYIRGVGERSGYARVDPTVGVYLDNIFLPRTDGQILDTIDIESIQVLRGPQGTLFGKNTTGGAMVISLAKPEDFVSGYAELGAGNYQAGNFKAGVNLPLSDNVLTRFSVSAVRDDGYINDVREDEQYSSKNRQAGIAQLRWTPSEELLLDFLAYYGHSDETKPLAAGDCSIVSEQALFQRGLFIMFQGDTIANQPSTLRNNCEQNSFENLGDLNADLGSNSRHEYEYENLILGMTAEWEFNTGDTLKFILSRRSAVEGPSLGADADAGRIDILETSSIGDSERDSYSAELQFTGLALDDRLSYTSGLFYMDEANTETLLVYTALGGLDGETLAQFGAGMNPTGPTTALGTIPFVGALTGPITQSEFDLDTQTAGIYGQVSYDFTENFQATLGIRHTRENRGTHLVFTEADEQAITNQLLASGRFGAPVMGFHPYLLGWATDPVGFANSLFPDANGDGIADYEMDFANQRIETREKTYSETTPMISASYNVPVDALAGGALSFINSVMFYGTISEGFKSGFFEPRGVDGLVLLEPERVLNRELGIKVDALQRRLRFNTAVYQMDFKNMQLVQVGTDSEGGIAIGFENAGESTISGIEIETQYMPYPGVLVSATFSHNDYEFVEFVDADFMDLSLRNERNLIDRSDEPFPVTPETSASLGLQYAFQTSVGVFTPRLDASYKGEIYYGVDRGAYEALQRDKSLVTSKPYTLLDARVSWLNNDGDVNVALFVKNLTDERYYIGGQATGDVVGTFAKTVGVPRIVGLQLRKEF